MMIPGIHQLVFLAVNSDYEFLVDVLAVLTRGTVSRMMLYYNCYYHLC